MNDKTMLEVQAAFIAKKLVDELFKLGSEPNMPSGDVNRIQFMAGIWPSWERPQGGMNKDAMIKFFTPILAATLGQTMKQNPTTEK